VAGSQPTTMAVAAAAIDLTRMIPPHVRQRQSIRLNPFPPIRRIKGNGQLYGTRPPGGQDDASRISLKNA
jgi:hypothetical protein